MAIIIALIGLCCAERTVTSAQTASTREKSSLTYPILSLGGDEGSSQSLAEERFLKHALGIPLESELPAGQDAAGNWGSVANGLQLSVRPTHAEFRSGEPVVVEVLTRNLTDTNRWVSGSEAVNPRMSSTEYGYTYVLTHGTTSWAWEKPAMEMSKEDLMSSRTRAMWSGQILCPHSQTAILVRLNSLFDLTQTGEYALRVKLWDKNYASSVVSGEAKFKVVAEYSPQEVAARRLSSARMDALRGRYAERQRQQSTRAQSEPKGIRVNEAQR